MHELSVAQSLIDLVIDQLPAEVPPRVCAVGIRVGVLSGVLPQALRSAFPAAAAGTPLAGARLDIEAVPLVVWCPDCRQERSPADGPLLRLRCPVCHARTPDVRRGRELEIISIEVGDPHDAAPAPADGTTTAPDRPASAAAHP